jgi:hypothetical protein
MRFGANTWIWNAPLSGAVLDQLVPHVAALGFEWTEIPLEIPTSINNTHMPNLIYLHERVCAAIWHPLARSSDHLTQQGLVCLRALVSNLI